MSNMTGEPGVTLAARAEHQRFLKHPGIPEKSRFKAAIGRSTGVFRLQIDDGGDLFSAIEGWAANHHCDALAFRLVCGSTRELRIMTGGPDPTGERVATFHGPHTVECPASVLGGHGTLGVGAEGAAMHAHVVFLDREGNARGCHVVRNHCIAGRDGILVALFPIECARFCVKPDIETQFNLFVPEIVASRIWSREDLK